jgi:hypothetical protein
MFKQFAFTRMYFKAAAILFLIGAYVATGCKEKNDGKLSTDLVTNGHGTPKMSFEETKFNFGKITQGEIVSHVFEFTNTGDGDLVISQATASCGCTIPEWPKEPIKPGEKGKILVKFNSQGKEGMETKGISIDANTKPPTNSLTIIAEVMKPDKQ